MDFRSTRFIAFALFAASFLLRLIGIGWGLPNELHHQPYHPDELLNLGVTQQIDLAHGQVAPGFYHYGTAYFIAESIASKMVAAYGGGAPAPGEPGYWGSIGAQILAGRIINALCGSGAVVVAWLILRRITTLFGSLFGAGLIALAPGFVVHSRFATVDVFATFWLCLSALFALRILGALPGSIAQDDGREPRDLRDALLAGIFAGFAAGTKYTGILVLLVLWASLVMARRRGWAMALLAGTGACLLAFLASTPGAVLDWPKFAADFGFELGHSASGHGLVFVGTPSGFVFHIGNLFAGVGMLLTLGGVAGLVYAACRRHPWAIALLLFAAAYYAVIGRAEVKFLRYTFPLLLPLAAGFGYAVGSARRRGGWGHAAVALGIVGLAGIDFGGLAGTIKYSQFMSATDPRDEAAAYLKDVARDSMVGLVSDPWFYSPPLIPDAGVVNRGRLEPVFAELAEANHPLVTRYVPQGDLAQRVDWDGRLISKANPGYIVFSSFEVNDVDRLSRVAGLDADTQARVDRYVAFMKQLDDKYRPAAAFGSRPEMPAIHDLMYIRPIVWIYKRKDLR